MITIRIAQPEDAEDAQLVFNHKTVIGHLGGFTHLESVKGKIKKPATPSLWVAETDDAIVGAAMIASRSQSHLVKFGEIGVIEEYRRKRIATAMYFAMFCQGLLEGRRLYEDTIVGDNDIQHQLLPSIGVTRSGILRGRTASGKDIHLYQLNTLEGGVAEAVWRVADRISDEIEVKVSWTHYSEELLAKNLEILNKYEATKPIAAEMSGVRALVSKVCNVVEGPLELEHNAGKRSFFND